MLLTDDERHPFVQHLEEEAIWDIDGLLKAQLKKVVGAINDGLVESDSRNMWYLNKRFWQALLEEIR